MTARALLRPAVAVKETAISSWPIIRREFIGLLRTRKAFWVTVLTVAATGLIPLFAWPSASYINPWQSALAAFGVYTASLTGALFFFVPIVTASAITGERERETYELLYHTHITPSGIVLGKLIASGAYFVLIVALTFPMVSVLFLLGGFQAREFAIMGLGMLYSLAFLAVVGLWASMRNTRTSRAVVSALAFIIAFYFCLNLLLGFLAVFVIQQVPAQAQLILQQSVMVASFALPLLTAGLLLFFLLRNARFPDAPASRRRERRALKAAGLGGKPRPTPRTALTRRLLAPAAAGIPDSWNPVFVNAVRSEMFGSATFRRKAFWGLALACTLVGSMMAYGGLRPYAVAQAWCFILICALGIVIPGATAATVTSERELGKLDFLRGTLLTPGQILLGKLLAVLFGASGILILGAIGCAVFIPVLLGSDRGFLPSSRPLGCLLLLPTAITVTFLAASGGILASTLARTSVSAMILSYVLTMGYLLAAPLLFAWVSRTPESLLFVSPLASYAALWFDHESNLVYYVFSHCFALLLSAAALAWAITHFGTRRMRDA